MNFVKAPGLTTGRKEIIIYRGMMAKKVWYAKQVKGEAWNFKFYRIPFFFLKHMEQGKSIYAENMIFGGHRPN